MEFDLDNYARDPQFLGILRELKRACETLMGNVSDMGCIPEQEFINTLWPGRTQHLTTNPMLNFENRKLHNICNAKWASICYKKLQDLEEGFGWRIYKSIFNINQEASIFVIANLIGFAPIDKFKFTHYDFFYDSLLNYFITNL